MLKNYGPRTKHVDIRHHFICDLVEDKIVSFEYVQIEGVKLLIFSLNLWMCLGLNYLEDP